MNYQFVSRTDTGRVRTNNEDAVGFDAPERLAVLADGMGGYKAGEVASAMTIATVRAHLGAWLRGAGAAPTVMQVRHAMEIAVARANASVFDTSVANEDCRGMGTTLVVGVFSGANLVLGHIGDSRCYRIRGGLLDQITRDHSLLQDQIDAGWVTPEQALFSNIRNILTRALGIEPATPLEVHEHRVEAGDVYLMCSDGLSDMIEDASIARIMGEAPDLSACADALVSAANECGGRDNISVLLVQVSAEP